MPTPPPVPSTRLTDFSGRLSPMLVKELRQGMRTNLFVIAFILLQAFMVLCLIAGLANPNSSDTNGFFWFFIVATLLIVQPLRGFSALSAEYSLNTMDLIQLTKLDGWRITLGKWTAINAQTLLFISGVLPYLVIRYFIGNVNFVVDLVVLLLIGVGSALATAITIGMSVFKNIVLRGILVVALGFVVTGLTGIGQNELFRDGLSVEALTTMAMIIAVAVYGCYFFLSFGASRIAPLSENQATKKRLIALFAAAVPLMFLFFDIEEFATVALSCIILALASIDALTEPLPIYSRVLQPFRRNPLTRFASLFLAPGWISGIGFFLVASLFLFAGVCLAAVVGKEKVLNEMEEYIIVISMCNVVIFPLLIIHLFFRNQSSSQFQFGLYIFIQCGLVLFTILIVAMANTIGKESLIYALAPLPSALIVGAQSNDADTPLFLGITIATTLICTILPPLLHRHSLRSFFYNLKKQP